MINKINLNLVLSYLNDARTLVNFKFEKQCGVNNSHLIKNRLTGWEICRMIRMYL